ncbi:trafficking kinesin-binding protein 1 isoform X3 [Patella vulgata]|uniref:trafficking kinesin-binding protein 1 isoform X3 n=2 Tax=Patella vulgata TaxID=6465 RepID=UPI0024A7B42A|nr:trafficking kinesin-binding protein 1 isoform X3 [Patella vulgata]
MAVYQAVGCCRRETILCADRVTQMTKTYNDIEAVTRLLEEKERDLELAARIGTTLLDKNRDLESRTENLEEQLTSANEKVSQLRHDVSMKDELLRVYCQDFENDGIEAPQASPQEGGFSLSVVKVEGLHKKVKSLEDENLSLRLETAQLKSDTCDMEEKEKKLVEDCLQQLSEVNQQVETFAEELSKKSDDNIRQKEEITTLLSQVVDLQKRVRSLTIENMELSKHLQASQESQRKLTKELGMMQDRYDELFELLEEANDELKVLRRKQRPSGAAPYISSTLFNVPSDSLASELEFSMKGEGELGTLSPEERRAHNWKIFETAKAAKKACKKNQQLLKMSSAALTRDGTDGRGVSGPSSMCLSDVESGATSDGYGGDMDSQYSSGSDLGRPGIPGSNDLETALKHLAMRTANELNEKDYYEEQKKKEMQQKSGNSTPGNMSAGSSFSYLSFPGSQNTPYFKIPEKLQIVKPLEGSATLGKWQQLATPHIGGIFENRPGVQIKGERKLDIDEEPYTLSDFEEDDDFSDCPTNRRLDDSSSSVYTYTNSTVKHPYQLDVASNMQADTSLVDFARHISTGINTSVVMTPMQSSTPAKGSGAKTTSSGSTNYSMSLGLAAILNSRETAGLDSGVSFRSSPSTKMFKLPLAKSNTETVSKSSPEKVTTFASPDSEASGGNIFNKLKSTGATLYEYMSGAKIESSSPTSPKSSSEVTPTEPNVKVLTKSETKTGESGVSGKLLQQGGTGVLGALTSFRRSGIL